MFRSRVRTSPSSPPLPPLPEVDASRSESALPVAVEEMGPLRLRAAHVLPEQQRPLRRLLHYAASICPRRLFMSQCATHPTRAPSLRHAAEFGATLTHFHISTLSHFHNSTFSHFQRPHDSPPGGVGIASSLAAASQNPTSAHLSACGTAPPCASQQNLVQYVLNPSKGSYPAARLCQRGTGS